MSLGIRRRQSHIPRCRRDALQLSLPLPTNRGLQYASFAPRAQLRILTILAYENGTSALLLLLSGTLPVSFRGATYGFPVAIWVPHAYPREGPIVYVTPAKDMLVRPGQHVSGDGRIYHPYLAQWEKYWDVSLICIEALVKLLAPWIGRSADGYATLEIYVVRLPGSAKSCVCKGAARSVEAAAECASATTTASTTARTSTSSRMATLSTGLIYSFSLPGSLVSCAGAPSKTTEAVRTE